MAKIVLSDSNRDRLLIDLGKKVLPKKIDNSTTKLKPENKKNLKLTFLSSEFKEDKNSIYEIAKVKIELTSNKGNRAELAGKIQVGASFNDHFIKIGKFVDLELQDGISVRGANTFSVESNFNYISQDYDVLTSKVDEKTLAPIVLKTRKKDFLNFKKDKRFKFLGYPKPDTLKDFVIKQQKFEDQKEYPYYVRVAMNSYENSNISEFTQKLGIYDELLYSYLNSPKQILQVNLDNGVTTTENLQLGTYDLSSFFSTDIEIDLDNYSGLNQKKIASKMSKDFRKHLFQGYLKNAGKIGMRSFRDIINNNECEKEIFAYSVEKFDNIILDSTKIQTFYSPLKDGTTKIIDTQIKYGKQYAYKTSAHYMVVGNSYRYTDTIIKEEDGNYFALVTIENRPSIKMMPIELFRKNKTIIQHPPIQPQVTFKTENNSENKIYLYLSPTKGEREQEFVALTNNDYSQSEQMYLFQNSTTGKYKFKHYDEDGVFEVFRIDYEPSSIYDFSQSKVGEVRMAYKTDAAIYTDKIQTNKDYYYICRKINTKGLVSNPTSIFKVRLLVDADDSKVITEVFTPKITKPAQDTNQFKSLLRIAPALEQTLFNNNQQVLFNKNSLVGTLKELNLGTAEKSVWGRKIKFRIKSKTSGKIIDLNLTFELTKNKTEEEF